jgi:hypothetical protein
MRATDRPVCRSHSLTVPSSEHDMIDSIKIDTWVTCSSNQTADQNATVPNIRTTTIHATTARSAVSIKYRGELLVCTRFPNQETREHRQSQGEPTHLGSKRLSRQRLVQTMIWPCQSYVRTGRTRTNGRIGDVRRPRGPLRWSDTRRAVGPTPSPSCQPTKSPRSISPRFNSVSTGVNTHAYGQRPASAQCAQ